MWPILSATLDWLVTQSVRAVITLTPNPLGIDVLRRRRPDLLETFTCLHLPVRDFQPPKPDQLHWAVDFIERHNRHGAAVLVHCLGGLGRTGTVLACYLVAHGYAPDAAITEVRRARPGSIESDGQEQAVHDFSRINK